MSCSAEIHIRTDRVRLRDLGASDIDDVHRIVGDPAVTHWLSFDRRSRSDTQMMLDGIIDRAKQEPRSEYYLGVDLEGKVIGFARLGLGGVRAAKLGYAITSSMWGEGYASEVVHAVVQFGFLHLGLHRISAAVGPDNLASIRVVEKAGFGYEGTLRHHVFTNGAWRDSRLYSIIAR